MPEVTGLLLAAGKSSRFGSQKLLHPIQDQPLILHSAASLSACDRVIAVVREEDLTLQQTLQSAGIDFIINQAAEQGMGSSLACGVQASEDSDGWCILPADMPFVDATTTRWIVSHLRHGAQLVAPFFQGRRGHPVGFCRRFRHRLLVLKGDHGARGILTAEPDAIISVEVDDSGILIDIDSPKDLLMHGIAL
ncbi:MAG: nucleotidyltransferase family protein [Pseudomonadota bacterium]